MEQVLWDDDNGNSNSNSNGTTPETSRDRDTTKYQQINPSEASSSDVTQTTPIAVVSKDETTAQIASDEVNSSIDQFYCDASTENISNFNIQVIIIFR